MTNQVTIDPRNPFALARSVLGFTGAVALVLGLLILLWPAATGQVIAWLLIAYTLLSAIAYIAGGIFSGNHTGWWRIGSVIIGVVFGGASIVMFMNLGVATILLASVLAIAVGVTWIAEGILALVTLRDARSTVWNILYGIVSIVAGLVVVTSPFWSAAVLWWLFGVALVALGIVQLVRAFQIGKALR